MMYQCRRCKRNRMSFQVRKSKRPGRYSGYLCIDEKECKKIANLAWRKENEKYIKEYNASLDDHKSTKHDNEFHLIVKCLKRCGQLIKHGFMQPFGYGK